MTSALSSRMLALLLALLLASMGQGCGSAILIHRRFVVRALHEVLEMR